MANKCTKFEASTSRYSRDILVGLKIFHGSHDVTTPLSGTVCCP